MGYSQHFPNTFGYRRSHNSSGGTMPAWETLLKGGAESEMLWYRVLIKTCRKSCMQAAALFEGGPREADPSHGQECLHTGTATVRVVLCRPQGMGCRQVAVVTAHPPLVGGLPPRKWLGCIVNHLSFPTWPGPKAYPTQREFFPILTHVRP